MQVKLPALRRPEVDKHLGNWLYVKGTLLGVPRSVTALRDFYRLRFKSRNNKAVTGHRTPRSTAFDVLL